jgi:hypothetical protein
VGMWILGASGSVWHNGQLSHVAFRPSSDRSVPAESSAAGPHRLLERLSRAETWSATLSGR